jgi:hypothetical protein
VADDAYVLLCTCREMGELQMVRAALEARGVPVRIEGAAVHGVLGMIHGAALAPRVMVPPPWRATAREIVADIVGPFDEDPDDARDDAQREDLPFRTAAAETDEAEDDDAQDVAATDEDENEVAAPPRRSLAIPVMLGMLALPWGFGHVYARQPAIGLSLMAVALVAAILFFSGVYQAGALLIAVAITDVVGSMIFVVRYNRALPAK